MGCSPKKKKNSVPPVTAERPAPRLTAEEAARVFLDFDTELGTIVAQDGADCASLGNDLTQLLQKHRDRLQEAFYFKFSLETYSEEHLAFIERTKENDSSRHNHELMKRIEKCKTNPNVHQFQQEYTDLLLGYFLYEP